MFRPLFYCHVPSNLGNRQLEQGRINVIGSFFGKSAFFFISHIAAMCWDPSYEYPVVLSQFVNHQHCVKGSFVLYFGVVKSHNCRLADISQFMTTFLFLISAIIRWDVALPTEKLQLETVALLPR